MRVRGRLLLPFLPVTPLRVAPLPHPLLRGIRPGVTYAIIVIAGALKVNP